MISGFERGGYRERLRKETNMEDNKKVAYYRILNEPIPEAAKEAFKRPPFFLSKKEKKND